MARVAQRDVVLSRFKGSGKGRCFILGNGPSLANLDLSALAGMVVFTTNRALSLYPSPKYHVTLEKAHALREPAAYEALAKAGKLWTAGEWSIGHVVPLLNGGPVSFSRDMTHGVVTQIGTTGSVIYAALQLAAWMGYGPLYLIGVDLAGPHFDGSPASKNLIAQNSLFRHVPADVEVYVVGESKAIFPKRTLEEAIGA